MTTIGEAAHIAAAAPGQGARRFNAAMLPEERSGIGNAIWLCADHARLVDRDQVTYTADRLIAMKREHEAACARAVKIGANMEIQTGLLAVGPDIVCSGEIVLLTATSWTLRLQHFLTGDLHQLISLISGFSSFPSESRYILSNDLGDGRELREAPSLAKEADGFHLHCPISPPAQRLDVRNIGSDLAIHPETGDLYLNESGDLARVSGLDRLPQLVQSLLSTQRGESWFAPNFGVRFFEYFDAFRGSPWLDLLLKLEVVRQASIPLIDDLTGRQYLPLLCVSRVRRIELLAETPVDNKLPVRVDFDVQGFGSWEQELTILMPNAEQVAERAAALAKRPWLFGATKPTPP